MRIFDWEIMAYGAPALFIYGWPDRWFSDVASVNPRRTPHN
jgi:hypothetical protein